MKKLFTFWTAMLITCIVSAQVSTWDGTHEPWTHGTGTEADPFLIENARQLAYLAYRVNNGLDAGGTHISNHDYHYKLMVDVELNGSEEFQWTPIGYWNSNTDYQCFGGCFNGNDHKIYGMHINSSSNRVGFWGFTDGATIMNITVNGTKVSTSGAGSCAGGVVGVANNTYILKCNSEFIEGISTFGINASTSAGGIVGSLVGTATITNCYNAGAVSVSSYTGYSGGIVGQVSTATITNCYNIGAVSSSSYSGGILGQANTATITNCYNTGAVSASYYSGGIEGLGNTATITNCYNTGAVSASYYSGGILGVRNDGTITITNSYYLNTCGGDNTFGGQPMSVDAMKTHEFVETLNSGLCAWEYDYNSTNSGYPVLTGVLVITTTQETTNVTQSYATLHGVLEVENTGVQSQGFEYKKTTESNYQIVNVLGSGNISTIISRLTPSTEYTYRVFCTPEDCGTYYGEEQTFTTLPVSVTTYYATDLTGSSATLQGSVNIGDATLVSKGFEYRNVGNPNYTTVNVTGNNDNFTARVTGLTVNTTYEYRAFMNITENSTTYYGDTRTFEVSWLNSDTICIQNADMLRWVSEQCNSGTSFEGKYIKLMNDITLPENVPNNMTSIGVYPDHPFKGTFDGNGMHITNLYIDQPNTPYQGFFGYTLNANLYNVGLVNITASGRNYTGGMVAYAKNTYIRDCYVNGGTLFALSYCGGLVGYQEQGTNSIISGCYNTCEVTGNNYVGGLIGFSNYSTVRNSYVASMVEAQGEAVGAIIGGANEVLMYHCYFNTDLTGQTNAIGENNTGKEGGEGMTSTQMRDPQFVNTLNQGLTTPVWKRDFSLQINRGFPILQWQSGLGVNESYNIPVSLYPNPTNGSVTIEAEKLRHVSIFNAIGQKIYDGQAEGDVFECDLSSHDAGIYLIRLKTASGLVTKQVVLVK